MSTNKQNNIEDQEIDLSKIFQKIGDFFQGINASIFNCIQFFIKNWVIISILFILGFGIGIYLDKTQETYDHQIIVTPNFGSTDYLYNKIDLLESKIKANDTVFLKSIGIENPNKLILIEIEPIVDIYSFVNDKTHSVDNAQNTQNFELVKLLAEDGDIKKVVKDKLTSKNYTHHTIHIETEGFVTDKNTINPILDYLNKNDYFEDVQKVYVDNVKIKMAKNEGIISQIDGLLNEFSSATNNNQKSDKLVYYNENTQLNEIIQTKNILVSELGNQRLDLINFNKVIKTNSSAINVKNTKSINGKLKLVLPFILILGFIFIGFFRRFYKNQKALSLLNN